MTVPEARALLAAYGAPTLPTGNAAADARTRVRQFLGMMLTSLGTSTHQAGPTAHRYVPLVSAKKSRDMGLGRQAHPSMLLRSRVVAAALRGRGSD